jgi:hypothetical protein
MNAKLKAKEFDISIYEQPKMDRISNYWTEKQIEEIANLL